MATATANRHPHRLSGPGDPEASAGSYFPDWLPPTANHDDYTSIQVNPEDLHWISAGMVTPTIQQPTPVKTTLETWTLFTPT